MRARGRPPEHELTDDDRADVLAGAVYGQVVTAATTAALAGDDRLTAASIAGLTVLTMVVFWVAHVYAELISHGVVRADEPATGGQRVRTLLTTMAHEWPIAQAAFPTAIALLLASAGLYERRTGVVVALVLAMLALVGWGLAIGRRGGRSWAGSLLIALGSGAIGAVIVLAELALH